MSGVGTELGKLISEKLSKDLSGKWDSYGVAWCERNRELILSNLAEHLPGLNNVEYVDVLEAAISAAKEAGPSTKPETDFTDKPGSALESVIPKWLPAGDGCKCNDWRKKLDTWGYAETVRRREQVIDRLLHASTRLPFVLRSMPEALRRAGANRMLDKALALADPASG